MNRFTRLFTYPVTLALALSFTGGTQTIKSALTTMGGGLPSILAMVLGLCLLITIHEFGHWLVARIFGFKTPVFSIGFGKREWSWVLGTFWETEWRIAPILAGGYVSIPELGDETATKEDAEKAQSSPKRFPVWQRICVAAAGVTFNVISAAIMLFALFSIYGQPDFKVNSTYVTAVSDKVTIARDAGIQPNDRFVSVGGSKVVTPDDLLHAVQANKGKPTAVVMHRGNQDVTVNVTPDADGHIGIVIGADVERFYHKMSLGEAAVNSVTKTGDVIGLTFKGFGMMLGIVDKPANISDKDMEVRGIVGIVQMGAGALNTGIFDFVWFLMAISINLAVMNILPIPMLDGGHIVYFLIEGVTGKPVSLATKEKLARVFIALLFGLMFLGLFNDLKHILFG